MMATPRHDPRKCAMFNQQYSTTQEKIRKELSTIRKQEIEGMFKSNTMKEAMRQRKVRHWAQIELRQSTETIWAP